MELLALFSLADLCLLASGVLSLLLLARTAMVLTISRQQARWLMSAVFTMAALVVIGVLASDAVRLFDAAYRADLQPLPSLVVIGIAAALALMHLQFASLPLCGRELRRHPLAWCLAASSTFAAGWSAYRCQCLLSPPDAHLPALVDRSNPMEPEIAYIGVTDRGGVVPLFRSAAGVMPVEDAYHPGKIDPRVRNTVIMRGDPDPSSNCHGWVFTGGEFLLDERGVHSILAENGYAPCDEPRPGDLIIYFAGENLPAHSGLVSGILHDGTVIIESKWGVEGRFLHRPEDQPYAARFAYYRSPRHGHEIAIRAAANPPALAKQRLPRKRIKRA